MTPRIRSLMIQLLSLQACVAIAMPPKFSLNLGGSSKGGAHRLGPGESRATRLTYPGRNNADALGEPANSDTFRPSVLDDGLPQRSFEVPPVLADAIRAGTRQRLDEAAGTENLAAQVSPRDPLELPVVKSEAGSPTQAGILPAVLGKPPSNDYVQLRFQEPIKYRGAPVTRTFVSASAIDKTVQYYGRRTNTQLTEDEYVARAWIGLQGDNPDLGTVRLVHFANLDRETDELVRPILNILRNEQTPDTPVGPPANPYGSSNLIRLDRNSNDPIDRDAFNALYIQHEPQALREGAIRYPEVFGDNMEVKAIYVGSGHPGMVVEIGPRP
ncbi:hypothetical protein ABW19_dt0205709 [Dactylella cylindrospora]|nr:hypothetical protein ABW19_dt0205709 [Dactylella cylindrospora]